VTPLWIVWMNVVDEVEGEHSMPIAVMQSRIRIRGFDREGYYPPGWAGLLFRGAGTLGNRFARAGPFRTGQAYSLEPEPRAGRLAQPRGLAVHGCAEIVHNQLVVQGSAQPGGCAGCLCTAVSHGQCGLGEAPILGGEAPCSQMIGMAFGASPETPLTLQWLALLGSAKGMVTHNW
jgi:hypothetical protein